MTGRYQVHILLGVRNIKAHCIVLCNLMNICLTTIICLFVYFHFLFINHGVNDMMCKEILKFS